MPSTRSWFVAVGAALALAAPLSAQQTPTDAALVPVAAAAQVATPSLAPTSLGAALSVRLAPVMAPTESMLPQQARESGNVALMIVGGAALVVGSLVDGDPGTIIMLGGATAGLIGLYRYLR